MTTEFADDMVRVEDSTPHERFFDRFVFNLHQVDSAVPSVLIGHGVYPGRNTADGFAIVVDGVVQTNLRWSTEFDSTDSRSAGPFSFAVVEENRVWRLRLADNPTELTFDLEWTARAPYWAGSIDVENASNEKTSFDHLFQSGHYTGALNLRGRSWDVDGWYGQRDRSRGVRTMSGGQGLHQWIQIQFPDRSVGVLLVESRTGERILLEGAVMHVDGRVDDVIDVKHALDLADIDLRGGRLEVRTESGESYDIAVDASGHGGFMAGGGYGGHHGKPMGRDHVEHDSYPLDGTVTQRTLDSSLTDRLATFNWNGVAGSGVHEFALSRSSSYTYAPTLPVIG